MICNICKQEKPLSEFYKNITPKYLIKKCKSCYLKEKQKRGAAHNRKESKLCIGCKIYKKFEEFSFKNKSQKIRNKYCDECISKKRVVREKYKYPYDEDCYVKTDDEINEQIKKWKKHGF